MPQTIADAMRQGMANAEMADYERRVRTYLERPLVEITRNEYHYQLDQLPPLMWTTHEGMSVFMCCEPQIDVVHSQYAQAGDRYFTKYVKRTTRGTWITQEEVRNYIALDKSDDLPAPMPKSAKLIIQNVLSGELSEALAQNAITIDELQDLSEVIHERLYFGGKLKDY